MRATILPVASFVALGLGVGAASAASPSYCALFAKKFVEYASRDEQQPPSKLVHDRAYHKCLNLDNEPPLPTAYTDPATDGNGRPFVVEDEAATAVVDEKVPDVPAAAGSARQDPAPTPPPVEETAALEPEQQTDAKAAKPERGWRSWMSGVMGKFRHDPPPSPSQSPASTREVSVIGDWGRTMTASERSSWCAEHFPKSYDPKTGTVIPYETGVRTRC